LRCHRTEELENELPAQLKNAIELLKAGELQDAKALANNIAQKNLQMNLPGIDEELRVLFKKIKSKRADSAKSIYAA
jgi:phage-related tail protein